MIVFVLFPPLNLLQSFELLLALHLVIHDQPAGKQLRHSHHRAT